MEYSSFVVVGPVFVKCRVMQARMASNGFVAEVDFELLTFCFYLGIPGLLSFEGVPPPPQYFTVALDVLELTL